VKFISGSGGFTAAVDFGCGSGRSLKEVDFCSVSCEVTTVVDFGSDNGGFYLVVDFCFGSGRFLQLWSSCSG
jgi:hypothetical protein